MTANLTPLLLEIERARYSSASSFELLETYLGTRDNGAFRALVAREGPAVYAVCYGEAPGPETAAEAFQEVFLELVRRGRMIRDENKLRAWLRQAARRIARRAATRDRARRRAEADHVRDIASESAADAAAALERSACVWREVRRLPDLYRTPLELGYLAGMAPPEIATQLGVPVKTVKTRLLRGLKKLRPALRRLGLGAALAAADTARSGAMPSALVNDTLGAVGRAFPNGGSSTAASALAALWRYRLMVIAVALALAGAAATGALLATAGTSPTPAFPPPVQRMPESLQAKNLRLFRSDILPGSSPKRRRQCPTTN